MSGFCLGSFAVTGPAAPLPLMQQGRRRKEAEAPHLSSGDLANGIVSSSGTRQDYFKISSRRVSLQSTQLVQWSSRDGPSDCLGSVQFPPSCACALLSPALLLLLKEREAKTCCSLINKQQFVSPAPDPGVAVVLCG